MFLKKWREHWGLAEDPFNCEDADKDLLLSEIDSAAGHSGLDRIFGNPRAPAPGIVFGEKGSGKSAIRLMIGRRLAEYNETHPEDKVFLVDYINYNTSLERFRARVAGGSDGDEAVREVTNRWELSDHLDVILALGVTSLVNELAASGNKVKTLSRKQVLDLLVMTGLYYDSDKMTRVEALSKLKSLVGGRSLRRTWFGLLTVLTSSLAALAGVLPFFTEAFAKAPLFWHGLGGGVFVIAWFWFLLGGWRVKRAARRGVGSIKVLETHPEPLAQILLGYSPKERHECLLPQGSREDDRYEMLKRFITLLDAFGYRGVYVLMDRIDEPSLLSANAEGMRRFVEKLLDIKLLQYSHLGIKLFLPIELDGIYRNATPEQLKRMRLDKSNLIAELKWTGQELFEIANTRMQACQEGNKYPKHLRDCFEEDFDFDHIRQTLTALGTPRYAFGFLASLITDYVRDLPNDLAADDPRWRITRAHFDIIRAQWMDQSGILRRVLN